jgi:hypothetical protein
VIGPIYYSDAGGEWRVEIGNWRLEIGDCEDNLQSKKLFEKGVASPTIRGGKGVLEGASPSNSPFQTVSYLA